MSDTAPRELPASSRLFPILLLTAIGIVVLAGVALDRAGVFKGDHRKMAPDVSFYDRAGKSVSLADYRGKIVLLNFWATWCGPCVAEAPSLASLSDELSRKLPDVVVLAPALDTEGFKAIDPFVQKLHLESLAVFHDRKRAANAFGTRLLPETWLISRDGEILDRYVGAVDWSDPEVYARLERLAKKGTETASAGTAP